MTHTPIAAPILRRALDTALRGLALVLPPKRGTDLNAIVDVYTESLLDIDPETLPEVMRTILGRDEYFPKPARIRQVAREVADRRRITFPGTVPGSGAQHGTDTTERCPQCFTAYEPRGTLGRLFCDCQWALHAPHEDANAAARQTSAIDDARRHRVGGFAPLGEVIAGVLPEVLPGVELPAELRPAEPPPVLATTASEPPAWDGPPPWERDDA